MRVNKYIPGLLILLLLALAVFWLAERRQHVDPLDFLPSRTLVMVDVRQPAAMYDAYRQSPLGQRIASIRPVGLLCDLGMNPEDAQHIQEELLRVQTFLAGPLFQELFSRRAVLALLPPVTGRPGTGVLGIPDLHSLVLVAEPRHRTDIVGVLAPFLAGRNQMVSESYRGRELKSFPLSDNERLTIAASDGILIFSFSSALVKECLDLGLQGNVFPSERLSGNESYISLRREAEGRDDQFIYGDISALSQLNGRSFSQAATGTGLKIGEDGIHPGAVYCATEKERLRCTFSLPQLSAGNFAGEKNPGYPPPETDSSLTAVPAAPALHYWTNLFSLPRLAADMQEYPRLQELAAQVDEKLVRKTGMRLQQLLSLFGSEFSVTVTGMRGSGIFPFPRLYGRLSVADQQRLEESLRKLLVDKHQVDTKLAGLTIHTLVLAGGMVQPSYALRNGYLYFGDSPQEIAQGHLPGTTPLVGTDPFRKADIGLAEPNNMIGYASVPKFLEAAQQLFSWSAVVLSLTDQEHGDRFLAVVNQLVVPILEGMKMWSAASTRLFTSAEGLRADLTLVFADAAGSE